MSDNKMIAKMKYPDSIVIYTDKMNVYVCSSHVANLVYESYLGTHLHVIDLSRNKCLNKIDFNKLIIKTIFKN